MRSRFLLAIDAGSTNLRCLVFDTSGSLISCATRDYIYQSQTDSSLLAREFNSRLVWENICQCIRSALYSAGIRAEEICSISTTSQREGAVFLDKNGDELYAGPNIDLRAVSEGAGLDKEYGSLIYDITGHLPSLLFVPAKLLWFKKTRPELFEKITTVLSLSDWIIFRLTGNRYGEICSAVELGLADVRTRRISAEVLRISGLPAGLYPEIIPAGSKAGVISPSAAAATGLMGGTAVIQGAPDTVCGLIGLGLCENGETGIVSGWSMPVVMVTDKPVFEIQHRIWTSCHLFGTRWVLESNCGEAGNLLNWLRELFFDGSTGNGFDNLDAMAKDVPPGAEGVMAFAGAEAMDMSHLAVRLGGFLIPVPLSATGIRNAHLARATFENVAFAVRANCQQLEKTAGVEIAKVAMGGGLVRFHCLREILPAVLNRPVRFSHLAEISGLGAAMLAATGSKVYPDLAEAISCMKTDMETVEPDAALAMEYEEIYEQWLSTCDKLKTMGRDLK